jgi:hypothetical protein
MTPNRHRIQRQVVELTLGDAAAAPGVQESLARACREPLLAGMTAVFDTVAPADVLLRLDRLEIDVGRLAGSDWAEQFQHRVVDELNRQLEKQPRKSAGRATGAQAEAGGGDFDAFVHFLRHGRLPWWGSAPEAGWSTLVTGAGPAGLGELRALLRDSAPARIRIVDVLDDASLQQLVASFGGPPGCALAMRALRPAEVAATLHRWRQKFWRRVVESSVQSGAAMKEGTALMRVLMRERCSLAFEQGRADFAGEHRDRAAASSTMRAVDLVALPEPWRAWCESAASAEEPDEAAMLPPDTPARAEKASAPKLRKVSGAPANDTQAIYLPGAGLLLLHPFLETLFRDRDLLEGKSFASDESRARAALLLGYLATGRADTPEYELGMARLLTGIDADAPIESAWLDEADITACDVLLEAVLGHWTALRSSSAAWLRSQFFLRDARLETVDDGYRVTVERRAQDVLLARLPWGFGVISLPWLRERIFVQWLD